MNIRVDGVWGARETEYCHGCIVILVLLTTLCCNEAISQDKEELKNGIDVGLVKSKLRDKAKYGITFGYKREINTKIKWIKVRAGCKYIQKGGEGHLEVHDNTTGEHEYSGMAKLHANYIEIPAEINIHREFKDLKAYLIAGIYLALKQSVRAKYEVGGEEYSRSIAFMRNVTSGYIFGGGMKIGRLAIEARMEIDIQDAWSDPERDKKSMQAYSFIEKNRLFTIGVGVTY